MKTGSTAHKNALWKQVSFKIKGCKIEGQLYIMSPCKFPRTEQMLQNAPYNLCALLVSADKQLVMYILNLQHNSYQYFQIIKDYRMSSMIYFCMNQQLHSNDQLLHSNAAQYKNKLLNKCNNTITLYRLFSNKFMDILHDIKSNFR